MMLKVEHKIARSLRNVILKGVEDRALDCS